ncbi:unnamed protein product [Adineta ricciae]|uniref:Mitochondria-eating protein n=1 Tax=Adineta ricciae TaxID=249248 RepID=A0A813PGP0_ADIRI|nr:unnamed protein product [Adineta ricciae]CAF1359811.1 unnamed protein product [Adineta ricciae]
MSAKIFLRRLTDIASFDTLQDKLSRLNDTYLVNSIDTNVSRCIDIIELNARVQRELFKLLNLVSAEGNSLGLLNQSCHEKAGGVYGGASTIRARLLPFLNLEASYLNGLLSNTGSDLYPYAWWRYPYAHLRTSAEFHSLANEYESNLNNLELDLRDANEDNARLEAELEETRAELIDERTKSTGEKMFIEAELSNLRSRLSDTEFRLSLERFKPRSDIALNQAERDIRRLRNDVELAQIRSRSSSPVPSYTSRRPVSPTRSLVPLTSSSSSVQAVREDSLIQCYNDLNARERLSAMDILRTVSDDYDMNRRICFAVVQEAFSVAKRRSNEWKLRLRSQFAITHTGPDSLEDVVQDYINRNVEPYELPTLVSEIIGNLTRNPRLSLPLGVSYTIINTYIREAVRVAWHMSCLSYPMDVAFATDGEVFDSTKYRRSYDSEYGAPLVDHHVWPALMQGGRVVTTGEACTKRGASLNRSRAASPIRLGYTSPVRSRSVSPIRRSRTASPVRFAPTNRYY